MPSPTDVLFIAGNGRSGSTLLGVILGQLPGFFAVGELRRIWDRGLIENRECGCGVLFRECPTWRAIFDAAYGGMDRVDPERYVAFREGMTQTKHLPAMLAGRYRNGPRGDAAEYVDALDRLYAAIREVTGCDVIVDASKWPMYGYMLDRIPALRLAVVHLVRDPRAVAHSWTRKKRYEKDRVLEQQAAWRSTAYWLAWNPAIRRLWGGPNQRYLHLPYERFVAEPREATRAMVALTGREVADLPFSDERTVVLGRTHAVAGNIARLTRGPVEIRLDDAWRSEMPRAKRGTVTAMALPLLHRYGYRISAEAS